MQETLLHSPRPATALDGFPLLISVPRAASLLGISRASAYRLAKDGQLPSRRLGGRVYVVAAQLRGLVEDHQ
jgi:excisionase family DNA binding protein